MNNKQEAIKFLKAIFRSSKESIYTGEAGIGSKYETKFFKTDDIEGMANHALNIGNDAFFHLTTHDSKAAEQSARDRKGSAFNGKFRGQIKTSKQINALWLDLDLADANKDNGKNYPDADTALSVLRELPILPSIIVMSGSGYHVYWLLDESIPAQENLDLPRKWTELLREAFKGYDLDSVHDCARILRVPGTTNKGKTVKIVYLDENVRYSLDTVEHLVQHIPEKQFISYSGGSSNVVIDLKNKPSDEKMNELVKDKNFAKVFFKTFKYKSGDGSHSSTDWSLSLMTVKLGWQDQDIVDLLIYCRQCNNEATHEHNTNKYIRTIGRAKEYLKKS
jgi:hypothetical protein